MTDFKTLLSQLRRPRLLIHAARFGLPDYRRERDLRRLIGAAMPPERALPRLLREEERLENTRREGEAGYNLSRHVEVMIALLAEARLLPHPAEAKVPGCL